MDYNDILLFGKVKFVLVCTGIKHIVFVTNFTFGAVCNMPVLSDIHFCFTWRHH